MKRKLLLPLLIVALCSFNERSEAQVKVWPKPATAAFTYNITNSADNATLSVSAGTMRIHSNYVDSIRTAFRTVIPTMFAQSRYGTLASALSAVSATDDRAGEVLVSPGTTEITDTIYLTDPIFMRGAGSFSPKDAEWWNTGSRLRFSGLTIGLLDSTQGSRIEGISFIGDSVDVTKILLQTKRPQRQTTTLGHQGIEWNLFRNADSIGVEIVAPDNNSYFAHNRVELNNGHGLVVRTTDPGTIRGINPFVAFNRFLSNDSIQVVFDGMHHGGIVSNGILGAVNDKPLLFFDGLSDRMTIGNLVMLNDMEQDAGGQLNAAAIKFNNGDMNGILFNRIGAGQRGIELTGSGSRSLLFMHNTITAVDTVFYQKQGQLNLLSMNNRWSNDPTTYFKPHRGIVRTGGNLRYLDISATEQGTTIEAGGNASNVGLKLNQWAQSDVVLFDSAQTDVSKELQIYGNVGGTLYKTSLSYDGDFRITPDSGTVRVAGSRLQIASIDTNVVSNNTSSYIYNSSQGSATVYPFNSSGNLILQPRTSSSRDIVFMTGSTTPTNRVNITRNGNVGIGGVHGVADSSGGGQGVIALKNAAVNPSSSVSNGIVLFAKDVSGSSELVVRDEGGTETVLSDLTSSGEANTASNITGAGVGIFKQKSGVDLTFKRLKASNGITITDGTDSVFVAAKPRDWFWSSDDRTYSASDNYNIWYTSQAITITRVVGYTDAGTYAFNLYWRSEASPSSSGTAILSGTLTADTNSEATASFADATIPANSWIAVQSSAHATAAEVGINITYTID